MENLLDKAQKEHETPSLLEASLRLQKEMLREALPKGLESINSLPNIKQKELMAKSSFLDPSDNLIKVGGRLARADLTFGRKHPILVPDNIIGDALIGHIHANGLHHGRTSKGLTPRKVRHVAELGLPLELSYLCLLYTSPSPRD